MEKLIDECGFKVPPFCNWTVEDWQDKNHEYDEIRDNQLGWDITDFGLNDFENCGFSLITIRNGNQKNKIYKVYFIVNNGEWLKILFHLISLKT